MRWFSIVPSLLFLYGCGEDVGQCSGKEQGRETVIAGGYVVYAGQAILNQACAVGCHSSEAQGNARRGAPAELDFDLKPITEDFGDTVTDDGETHVELDTKDRAGLKKRRQTVLDERNMIWGQVQQGLMPPDGWLASLFERIYRSGDDPCTRGDALSELSNAEQREQLRNWLACGAPIVEAVSADVSEPGVAGELGEQYPVCETGEVTLDTLLSGPLSTCSACHKALYEPRIFSLETARASLIDNTDEACDGKPFVTPGEPENSFLYDLLANDEPGCAQDRMPFGGPYLSDSELAQVEAWIKGGAL